MKCRCLAVLFAVLVAAVASINAYGADTDIANVRNQLRVLHDQQATRGATVQVVEANKLNAAAAGGHAQIVGFAYYGTLTPGTTTTVFVLVYNAGTEPASSLVATFFSGPGGNLADDIVNGMISRDHAWPMISTGEIGPLNPGQMTSWIALTFKVPTDTVHGTSYANNWALWQLNPFGKGTYLDRACFLQSITP